MLMSDGKDEKINFGSIYEKVNEILVVARSIDQFPFRISEFISEYSDIRLCTYRRAMEKYGIPITAFGSESAVLQEYQGACVIFYNQDEADYRVRFSIAHEYGHYCLGHEMNLKQTNPKYQKQEVEANCFAAQLLMPEQLLRVAQRRGYPITVSFIMNSFGVSEAAAQKRKETLAKFEYEWHSRSEKEFDDSILLKYAEVINHIAPQKYDRFDFDDEYEREGERMSWMDTRTRWS